MATILIQIHALVFARWVLQSTSTLFVDQNAILRTHDKDATKNAKRGRALTCMPVEAESFTAL